MLKHARFEVSARDFLMFSLDVVRRISNLPVLEFIDLSIHGSLPGDLAGSFSIAEVSR